MTASNKTFLQTEIYKSRNWFIIDCKGQKLGRLATVIATLLRGKQKSHYHPSLDCGDYIVLINAKSILINKQSKKYIVNEPGRPGHSLKLKQASDCPPTFIIKQAVKNMLGKSEAKRLIKRLRIFNDQKHPYTTQRAIEFNTLEC